jgi:hypothetical protein
MDEAANKPHRKSKASKKDSKKKNAEANHRNPKVQAANKGLHFVLHEECIQARSTRFRNAAEEAACSTSGQNSFRAAAVYCGCSRPTEGVAS